MVEALAHTEVFEIVGAQLIAQERRELLVLLEEGIPEVGAVDMMAVGDLIDHGGKLAAVPAAETGAEDRCHLVGGEPPQAEFAAALEQLVDRKVAGRPRTVPHRGTATSFAIDWKGLYRIEGAAFVFTDRDTGSTTAAIGYLTNKLG
jgi:hypothetical protein